MDVPKYIEEGIVKISLIKNSMHVSINAKGTTIPKISILGIVVSVCSNFYYTPKLKPL